MLKIDLKLRPTTTLSTKQAQVNSTYHLQLQNDNFLLNWTDYFPNLTHLTLKRNDSAKEEEYISPMTFSRLLPCESITEFKAYVFHCRFKGLTQLIISSPNVEKLFVDRIGFNKTNRNLIAYDETFQQMSITKKN